MSHDLWQHETREAREASFRKTNSPRCFLLFPKRASHSLSLSLSLFLARSLAVPFDPRRPASFPTARRYRSAFDYAPLGTDEIAFLSAAAVHKFLHLRPPSAPCHRLLVPRVTRIYLRPSPSPRRKLCSVTVSRIRRRQLTRFAPLKRDRVEGEGS